MNKHELMVPVVGFPAQDLAGWPADLRPQPSKPGELAAGALVLVHSSSAGAYSDATAALSPASRPRALLYLDGSPPPRDAWRTFSGALRRGDWERLRAELDCPLRGEIVALAEEIAAGDLAPALALLDAGKLADLPLPPDAAPLGEHLAQHESCRREFAAALRARQEWAYRTMHPPMDRLAAYAYGEAEDAWTAAHIGQCPRCAAEAATLRRLDFGPAAPTPPTVEREPLLVPLTALHELFTDSPREMIGAGRIGTALLADFAAAGLQALPAWTGHLGNPSAAIEPDEEAEAGGATLIGAENELSLNWLADGSVAISDLRGAHGQPVAAFTVELWREGTLIWQASSVAGTVNIAASTLAAAASLLIRPA